MVKKLESAVALQQQKANQIGQWDKQAEAYQTWNQAPQTADMHLIAQGLGAPQIQERLAAINQPQKQSQQAPGQQKRDKGAGFIYVRLEKLVLSLYRDI